MGAYENVEQPRLLERVGVHHGEVDEAGPTCRVEVGGVDQAAGGVADDRGVEARVTGQLRIGPALAVVGGQSRGTGTPRPTAPHGSNTASSQP